MLDHYVVGSVDRISPEAPVPVVAVESESHGLGGAGNVARNIKGLGGEPVLLSVRGRDNDGSMLDQLLSESGIDARLAVDPARPTTRKIRIIAHNQQVVRVDWENAAGVSGPACEEIFAELEKSIEGTDAIILSDYGKGVITYDFMQRMWRLFERFNVSPDVFVDPKVRNFELYTGVTMLTPNAKEAAEGSNVRPGGRDGVLRAGIEIFKKLKCKELLITLGPDGMALFSGPDSVLRIPTSARKVYDVTGAGDTVIATTALAKAAGLDTLSACVLANFAAGLVVAEVGTVAVQADRLVEALNVASDTEMERWL
jgi:rfaE bifunctional protein kinase chain/domain